MRHFPWEALIWSVMPAQAGIQVVDFLGSRLRGNDVQKITQCFPES
jgi:hypothetical protein